MLSVARHGKHKRRTDTPVVSARPPLGGTHQKAEKVRKEDVDARLDGFIYLAAGKSAYVHEFAQSLPRLSQAQLMLT